MTAAPENIPAFARDYVNLASAGLGARIVSVTDDFFAEAPRMLADSPAVFIADRYDDNGKWMDGWESRRRRGPGHDHAIVRLAVPGEIRGFDVDTSHFTGNYPPACSIEACNVEGDPGADATWTRIVPQAPLGASAHHYIACASDQTWTHVRLNIYPDGGVARLRVFGVPSHDWSALAGQETDLASALNGGRVVAYSDAHYGAFFRMLAPGRGLNMGDGWETRRRREPGNDWIVVALGHAGTIGRVVVDTAFYKGNFPESCSIQGANLGDAASGLVKSTVTSSMFWPELLPRQKLSADTIHEFSAPTVIDVGAVTHVRLNIYPDGGISRLRLFGTPAP